MPWIWGRAWAAMGTRPIANQAEAILEGIALARGLDDALQAQWEKEASAR